MGLFLRHDPRLGRAVQRLAADLPALAEGLRANRSLAVVSPRVTAGRRPKQLILLADTGRSRGRAFACRCGSNHGSPGSQRSHCHGEPVFVEVHPGPPRLIIVGGVNIAEPLIDLARAVVRDGAGGPACAFASHERFPNAGQIINGWPDEVLPDLALDERAYVVVLTHDPKIDDPAL